MYGTYTVTRRRPTMVLQTMCSLIIVVATIYSCILVYYFIIVFLVTWSNSIVGSVLIHQLILAVACSYQLVLTYTTYNYTTLGPKSYVTMLSDVYADYRSEMYTIIILSRVVVLYFDFHQSTEGPNSLKGPWITSVLGLPRPHIISILGPPELQISRDNMESGTVKIIVLTPIGQNETTPIVG